VKRNVVAILLLLIGWSCPASLAQVEEDEAPAIQLDDPDAKQPAATDKAKPDQQPEPTPETTGPKEPYPDPAEDPDAAKAYLLEKQANGEPLTEVEEADLRTAEAAKVDSPFEGASMLVSYFGAVGMLSMLFWIVAAVLIAPYLLLGASTMLTGRSTMSSNLRRKRTPVLFVALGLGVLAYDFGHWNNENVSSMIPDQTRDLFLAKQRTEAKVERMEKADRANVQFAEDTDEDRQDLARLTKEEREKLEAERKKAEEAARKAEAMKAAAEREDGGPSLESSMEDGGVPAYKQSGKIEREEGKQKEGDDAPSVTKELDIIEQRVLPQPSVNRANTWNAWNLELTRNVWLVAFILLVLDYLSRFNGTVGNYLPLPLGGRIMDHFFGKQHLVHLQTNDRTSLEAFVRDAVAKGENFMYFGEDSAFIADEYHRLRLNENFVLWPRKVLRFDEDERPFSMHFVFESSWFSQYAFALHGRDLAVRTLRDMVERFNLRHMSRARTWGTVNLVWDFDEPLPEDLLDELRFHCSERNFRLVIVRPIAMDARAREAVSEHVVLREAEDVRRLPVHA